MKISLEWLRLYLPAAPSAERCGDALTHAGLPVEAFEKFDSDDVFDVEVTSNRPDCLSVIGVARELAAVLDLPFTLPQVTAPESRERINVPVRIDAPDLCPHYTARVIRGVKIAPSPAWMQRRLEAIGLRPINNVVDVTNYVLFETGQPLHAFDLAKLFSGGPEGRPEILVRRARPGESLTSIDGHDRKLAADMLVIADARRPVALAGVMGGKDSEVSHATVDVLLESARFDPLSVRKTARALAMKSDSSYRFERGIDPTLPLRASLRAAQLILETAGGALLAGVSEAGTPDYSPKHLTLRLHRLQQVLGVSFPADQVEDALRRLRLQPKRAGDAFDVTVPSDRLDLNVEIDLVEEVARIVGYDKIPTRAEIAIRVTPPEPAARTINTIRDTLVAAGYFEAVTFSFVSDALAGDFQPTDAASLPRADAAVRKADASLRPSILPGLLEAVRRNEAVGNAGAQLFEIGSTFRVDPAGKIDERRRLGLVGTADLRDLRGVVESILTKLDATRPVTVTPATLPGYTPGTSATVEWGGKTVGQLGLVAKTVANKIDLREPIAASELDVAPLLAGAQHVPQLRPLPRFPAVRRDLSFVLPEATAFERVDSLVHEQKPKDLESVEFVTTYRGKPLEKGQKSVTITLVFRSPEGTLTSEAVDAAINSVVTAAKDRLGATLRA